MALAQTDLPELKRFNFFVSRRFEEGRERFRLHMGYFATLAEAEEWLAIVREIYPGAWAGEAPGRKLRERAAAAQAAQAQHAAGPQPQRAPAASAPPPPAPAAMPAPAPAPAPAALVRKPDLSPLDAALSMRVPVLKAAPESPLPELIQTPRTPPRAAEPPKQAPARPVPAKAAAAPAPAPSAKAPPAKAAPPKAPLPKAAAPKPAPAPQPAPPAGPPRAAAPKPSPAKAAPAPAPAPLARSAPVASAPAPVAAKPVAPRPPAPAARAAAPAPAAARAEPAAAERTDRTRGVFGDSNVREVLQALGDASATGETRLMRAPVMPAAPAPAAEGGTVTKSSLTDTQVLKLLETRGPQGAEPAAADAGQSSIPMLKPDDTGTREALKEAVTADAPVLFAVQLQWSVQPVELDKVPPLAIFSAYTLYTVEGSRDGRKWFGLRLGFFSDAISAKQVAHYVRSEFTSVAVVPVSQQEKSRATDQDKAAAVATPAPARPKTAEEFKLIDDDTAQTEVAKLRANLVPAADAKAAPDAGARKIPGRPIPKVAVGRTVTPPVPAPAAPAARARAAGKVGAREKRGAQSLEETLEILGAGQLSIDDGRSATINDSGVRHLRVEVQKNSPFSKLLERLSERMKKP